ncbi:MULTISPECIES: general stress protein [unclassified Coleofasciculus]|uniref:general stress protein n=1 Tax=unclassified Coleofasciculus TaxID=2692782 RepID=UPI001D15DCF1|nr:MULTISPECIES: general stress protein [unclassified Coleofasciculus]
MVLGQHKRAIGIFSTRQEAKRALQELRDAGFPMSKISIIARDSDRIAGVNVQDDTGNEAAEGAAAGAVTGGVAGGIIGLIGALSAITVPGVGPILVGGAIASVIGTTLAGGAIGTAAGGLLGALMGLGIPESEAYIYHDRLERGEYLVIVDGTDEDMKRAASVLTLRGVQEWRIYEIPPVNTADPMYTSPIAAGNFGYPAPLGTTTTGPLGEPLPPATVTPTTAATPVTHRIRAVGVFPSYAELDAALNTLRAARFDMSKVSVIARDNQGREQVAGADMSEPTDTKAGEGAATGALAGGALGGLTGLLVGLGSLAVPGIGPIVFVGAEATAIASTLAGGAIGAAAGGFLGVLIGMGIPEDRAKIYIDRVSNGEYLVLIEGTEPQIRHAESVLSDRGIREWGTYNHPSAPVTSPSRVFP